MSQRVLNQVKGGAKSPLLSAIEFAKRSGLRVYIGTSGRLGCQLVRRLEKSHGAGARREHEGLRELAVFAAQREQRLTQNRLARRCQDELF